MTDKTSPRHRIACPHCGDVTEHDMLLVELTCGACDEPFVPSNAQEMMTASEEYYLGWNAAYADEGWDDNGSGEWKAGYSEARDALAEELEHST